MKHISRHDTITEFDRILTFAHSEQHVDLDRT